MSDIKAVIFDCDGVLVDSEPISNRVLVEMANELGASLDLDFAYEHFKGNALKTCIQIISDRVPITSHQEFELEFRQRSFKAFESGITPVKDIEQLLQQIELPYSVASSGPENKIRLNLELTGLLQYFENRIYSCYAIQKWKPEPDVFLWAARDMNLEPAQCLVVEDSAFGVEAAKKGGFVVCAYNSESDFSRLEEYADFCIDDMLKLMDYFLK